MTTSKAELYASRDLRAILEPLSAGASIEDSADFRDAQIALEFFLPSELGWQHEAFDAFRFAIARKVGPDEAEFVGLALLISDQSWTPIHLRLRLAPGSDRIAAMDCRVGEPGDGRSGLLRIPYGSRSVDRFLCRLPVRVDSIQWVYRVVWSSAAQRAAAADDRRARSRRRR
jgi:hypothetical protein